MARDVDSIVFEKISVGRFVLVAGCDAVTTSIPVSIYAIEARAIEWRHRVFQGIAIRAWLRQAKGFSLATRVDICVQTSHVRADNLLCVWLVEMTRWAVFEKARALVIAANVSILA